MAILQVRDLPEGIYRLIKQQAKKERRSISQQALFLLEKALSVNEDPIKKRRGVLLRISELNLRFSGGRELAPDKLIREDRSR